MKFRLHCSAYLGIALGDEARIRRNGAIFSLHQQKGQDEVDMIAKQ
jgi:hypothetical protein